MTLTSNLLFFICCSVALKSEIRKLNIVHVLIWVLMAAQVSHKHLVLSGVCIALVSWMLWESQTVHPIDRWTVNAGVVCVEMISWLQ